MSDDTTTPNPENRAPEGQLDPNTVASLPDWAQKVIRDLRTEAATNRTAVTEATTARDEARQALAAMHKRDATAGLSKILADPGDLERYISLDELVDEAGNPDPGKYAEAAATLAQERPHLGIARPSRSGNPVSGGSAWPKQGIDANAAAKAGTDAFVSMVNGT